MTELTTTQIAVLINRSERQVQRLIKTGKIEAIHIEKNRYNVDVEMLGRFYNQVAVSYDSERLDVLERRIERLEGILADSGKSRKPPVTGTSPGEDLPLDWKPLQELINEHSVPRSSVVRQMKPYIHDGHWNVLGHEIRHALDSEGIAEFERRYGHKRKG